jgi:putative transposase
VHAVAVNREGFRESPGLDVVTSEDRAGWLAFLRSSLAGSRASAWSARTRIPASSTRSPRRSPAAWQRCRTHFMRNVLTRVPEQPGGVGEARLELVDDPAVQLAHRLRVGLREGRPHHRRDDDAAPDLLAPASSASSPTAPPSFAWSAPCSPSNTTNGPSRAAT